jgi:hypothetical protein
LIIAIQLGGNEMMPGPWELFIVVPVVIFVGYLVIRMLTLPGSVKTTNRLLREQNDLLKKVQ